MDYRELEKFRELADEVVYSPTKNDAKHLLRKLEFLASTISGNFNSYIRGKLNEVVDSARQASGQVDDKEHWISCLDRSWYVAKNEIEKAMKSNGRA